MKKVKEMGYRVVNIDSTVMLETPKLRNYIDQMRENIAGLLEISMDAVSVKATTTEGLGYIGQNQGIMTQSIVLIEKEG
jgi:2-C-methyl-D-erythritol 2,4-cyclodiphosphate synthase